MELPRIHQLAPEERDRIILDNKMCSFCLLHKEGNICYRRETDRKPACPELECSEGHLKCLHNVVKVKSMSMNAVMNARQ